MLFKCMLLKSESKRQPSKVTVNVLLRKRDKYSVVSSALCVYTVSTHLTLTVAHTFKKQELA